MRSGLVLYRQREVAFYLGRPTPIPEFDAPGPLIDAVQARTVRWIIFRRRDRDIIPAGIHEMAAEQSFPWEGPQQTDYKLLLLAVDSDNSIRLERNSFK